MIRLDNNDTGLGKMKPIIKMCSSFAEEGTLFCKMLSFTTRCLENMAMKALGSVGLNKTYKT